MSFVLILTVIAAGAIETRAIEFPTLAACDAAGQLHQQRIEAATTANVVVVYSCAQRH